MNSVLCGVHQIEATDGIWQIVMHNQINIDLTLQSALLNHIE